jgi:hypothetical protein
MRRITCAVIAALVSCFAVVSVAAAAPGTGTLYGTDASSGRLLRIDRLTGAGTVVGPLGIGVVPALAVDPTTGTMYAGTGAGAPLLFTVDPATATATFVGDTGLGFAAIGSLDFRADGTLFAAVNIVGDGGTGSDFLATIDKATGRATLVGPFGTCGAFGCTLEGMEGIAFDAAGRLWGTLSARGAAGTPGLYRIDPANGRATFVAPIPASPGATPSGGVVSLQFACDGTLYGGSATGLGQADGGRLVTIDPVTGAAAFVGTASATEFGNSLGALAFGDPHCLPTRKEECKDGGWRRFGVFKNQGDCVSFVATRGRNQPSGAPPG